MGICKFTFILLLFPQVLLAEDIAFEIDIPVASFSSPLLITIWSEQKMNARDRNSKCTMSYDVASKKETINCPQGSLFEAVLPEKFSFPSQEKLSFTSKELKVGEKFEIMVSGRSSDKCNTTSAIMQDVLKSNKVVIKKLQWASTELACVN